MAQQADTLEWVRNYTKSSVERIASMQRMLCTIEDEHISGDVVEVGVWRAGNIMLARMLAPDRTCWLYDTFDGMTEPDPVLDIKVHGELNRAIDKYNSKKAAGRKWNSYPLWAVQNGFKDVGISMDRMYFVEGPIERTINLADAKPQAIALLRLDVDWHGPTKVAIEALYPLVVSGGFLIVDDYGHWLGARKAVDEYFGDAVPPWEDVDYTCRVFRKG